MENERDIRPVVWSGWISMILGIWLFVSPWALRYASHGEPLWNNLLLGILVLLVGILVASAGSSGPGWWNKVFGLWLILSPLLLHYTRLEHAMLNNIAVGVLVLIVGLIRSTPSRRAAAT